MGDRPSSKSRTPLSLEASLNEEYREVLATLDTRRASSPGTRQAHGTVTPPATMRSMLDADPYPSSSLQHGSTAGLPASVTSPRHAPPSRLDPTDPSTWTRAHSSKPNSPMLEKKQPVMRARGASDVGSAAGYVGLQKPEHSSSTPSSVSSRPRGPSGEATTVTISGDVSGEHVGQPASLSHRHNSTTATGKHSRSPSGRIASATVQSPGLLSPSSPRKVATAAGVTENSGAHRRLSDKSNSFSTATDDSEEAMARVPVDQRQEEDALESSDEAGSSGSEEESRGRSRYSGTGSDSKADTSQSSVDDRDHPGSTEQCQSHSQVIKSLLEPSIRITSPSGNGLELSHSEPQSQARDRRPSTSSMVSDDGEAHAIAKAKSLGLNISPLDTKVPDRHVRMIIRGDWARIYAEAESVGKTVRTYLACTDLSLEATYALEWTVGTIMRDGDTLLAIYSIEDETIGSPGVGSKDSEPEKEKLTAAGAQAGKEASDAMESLTRQVTNPETPNQSKFVPATELESLTGSVDSRKVGKREMERLKAIDDMTQTFLKFVRKTTLQVRCMIEVIHCKSPKHLIIGAIDELDPTLAVVGTRGKSSLKGVLLGSFSNYLVTKSSSPVMVARRKPKKAKVHAPISGNKARLSNNLTTSRLPRKSLTQARID
ncbi:hypothetical protein DV736_g4288, partial [Chaetothyriales sp. CBS 134916]